MSNYLELPPELRALIEKREAERRLADPLEREGNGEALPAGQVDRRQVEDRRSSSRRDDEGK